METTPATNGISKPNFGDMRLKSGFDKSVFDVYGTEHNVWMDSIAAAPNFATLFDEDLFDEAQTFVSSVFPPSSITWSDFQTVESYAKTLLDLTPTNARATLISDSLFDSSVSNILEMLFDITNSSRNLVDFQTKVSDLEDYIINNYHPDYDGSKKEGSAEALLLGACAIARNSGNYWNYAENNSGSPWYSRISGLPAPNPSSPSLHARLPRWLRAAARDIVVFVSSEKCVIDDHPLGIHMYDFVCAWKEAGNGSSQVQ